MTISPASFTSATKAPTNIAIIGGGIASLILVDFINKKNSNIKVTLICKDKEVAHQGSSNKQGAIYPLLQAGPSVISSFYANAFQHAVDYYRQRLPTSEVVPHQWCGVLQQAFNQSMPKKFIEVSQLWSHLCEYVDSDKSSAIAGINTPYPSLYYKDGGWLNPSKFCGWLAKELTGHENISIWYETKVKKITKALNGKQWDIIAENKTATYDQVVICGGVNSPQIQYGQVNSIPIDGVLGQVSSFNNDSVTNELKTVLCHKGYITPTDGEFQAFGATFEKSYNEVESTLQATLHNINQIKKMYPKEAWAQQININLVNHNNAAVRATTPDHIPIAGELFDWRWVKHHVDNNNGKYKRSDKIQGEFENPLKGLYCLTGLGARGLTSAPILADLVSELIVNNGIAGKSLTPLVDVVAPMRFQLREYKRTKNIPLKARNDSD